ncbi:MAG: SRPBCC family protein [Ktedonobacterales bacterium]
MRIDGTYLFPAPVERVFAALLDPDASARAIPGVERLIQLGPRDASGITFKAWLRDGDGLSVVTWHLVPVRQPAHLRLTLYGHVPAGPLSGSGILDLVAQEDHTRGAYALELDAPDGVAATLDAFARALCDRLARQTYTPPALIEEPDAAADAVAHLPLPVSNGAHSIVTPRGRIVGLRATSATPVDARYWAQRAVWMGAGLALGLAAVSLALAVAHRLNASDT